MAMASTTIYNKKCHHCGRPGHVKADCFHNPESASYPPYQERKGLKYQSNSNKGRKNGKRSPYRPNREYENKRDYGKSGYVTFIANNSNIQSPATYSQASEWFIDSGASAHMSFENLWFRTPLSKTEKMNVTVGNGEQADVKGMQSLYCSSEVGSEKRDIILEDTLFVPNLTWNLISVSKIRKSGFTVAFESERDGTGTCRVTDSDTNHTYMIGEEYDNGLYKVLLWPQSQRKRRSLVTTTDKNLAELWHQRLGHVSNKVIARTIDLVRGLPSMKSIQRRQCDTCLKTKSTRNQRPSSTNRVTKPLEIVHTDLVGPMKYPSTTGARYFIPLYDDATGLSIVRFLKTKSEAPSALKGIITELESASHTKNRVWRIRSDNAKEFTCASIARWLRQKGIRHELTSPYSPESNGKAERINRTLRDIARPLLQNIGSLRLRNHMWENAIATACYLRNRSYTSACYTPDSTPYQALTGEVPNLTHLRVFGSEAYSHIPKVHRHKKCSPRAQRGLHVGYCRGNSYNIFLPETNRRIVSRDVRFVEPMCSGGKHKCASFEPVLNKAKQGVSNSAKASQGDS